VIEEEEDQTRLGPVQVTEATSNKDLAFNRTMAMVIARPEAISTHHGEQASVFRLKVQVVKVVSVVQPSKGLSANRRLARSARQAHLCQADSNETMTNRTILPVQEQATEVGTIRETEVGIPDKVMTRGIKRERGIECLADCK